MENKCTKCGGTGWLHGCQNWSDSFMKQHGSPYYSIKCECKNMKHEKCEDGSYLGNCHLQRRENDPAPYLFNQSGTEYISCCLNGYAIIPLEEYQKLTGQDFSKFIRQSIEDDKEL